jgi:hypothetical protein
MKLLHFFKDLIVENRKPRKVIDSIEFNDKKILLFSSYHQWFDRNGEEDYETIKDIYFDKLNLTDNYRVGVPDRIITSLFRKNISKIENSFEQEKNERIIFVKERTDNDDEVDFDFIEFILQKKDNFYEIITSAYSDDGRFLVMGFPVRTKKVMSENKINRKYKIVYLS